MTSFSFFFLKGSCGELVVDCQFSLEGYRYILVLACPILYICIYVLWGHFNYMISNFFVLFKPKYQDKMKELLVDPSNQLQSSDTSGSIARSIDDVFAKVMGKERKCCIRGIGFSLSPSGRSSKSALTDIEIHSSQARDNEVAQLKASLATMEDKLASFDEMKKSLSQFEEMEQRMAHMLQQMQTISSQCNQVY